MMGVRDECRAIYTMRCRCNSHPMCPGELDIFNPVFGCVWLVTRGSMYQIADVVETKKVYIGVPDHETSI